MVATLILNSLIFFHFPVLLLWHFPLCFRIQTYVHQIFLIVTDYDYEYDTTLACADSVYIVLRVPCLWIFPLFSQISEAVSCIRKHLL